MLRAKSMSHNETADRPDDRRMFRPSGDHAASGVRIVLCAMVFGLFAACGGGGGSSGSSTSTGSGSTTGPTTPTTPTTASLLAVTNASNGTIDLLTIDTTAGTPSPVTGSPFTDGPAASAVAIDPLKRYLWVASSSGEIRGYIIEPSPLGLTAISGSPFTTGAPAVAIAADPSGEYVLTANGSANTVSVFQIGANGVLTEVAGSPFAAGTNPTAIVVADGQFVYAANTGSNSVSAYTLNLATGALTAVAGSPYATAAPPNGLVVNQTGSYVYTSETSPNEVSGFAIDATSGALTAVPGSPFAANDAVTPISTPVMDADNKRLHVANGTNVDCFLLDASNGSLTELGLSITDGLDVGLALDGPDNFLYALDNVANQVEVFQITPSDGALTLITGSPFALFSGAGSDNLGPNAIAVQH
jgi:6-phosphogluconolactonase (cycloisomerase 2 family)